VKALRLVLAAGLMVTLAVSASGQTVQTFRFTNAGNVTGFGYYVGPYQGQILSMPGQPTIDLYCVDFLHRISLGQVWTAWVSPLDGNLSYTRGGTGAAGLYQRAAWLTQQFYGQNVPTTQWAHIQAAIWSLFTNTGPTSTASSNWISLANQNFTVINPKYVKVITPTNMTASNSAQEFVTYATPEPETYAMLATGLFVLAFVYVRRRRQAGAAARF
jgi:hypothetical protein